MIFDELRAAFIQLPRSGGSTIRESLARHTPGRRLDAFPHAFASELGEIADLPSDWLVFSFVRNPWDRLAAMYRWSRRRHPVVKETLESAGKRRGVVSDFADWLQWLSRLREEVEEFPTPADHARSIRRRQSEGQVISAFTYMAALPQIDSLRWGDRPLASLIGRFENLDNDWATLTERLGVPDLELLELVPNPPERPHYSLFYDDASRRLAAGLCAADCEAFGYAFEDRR